MDFERRALFRIPPTKHSHIGCEICGLPYVGDHWVEAVVSLEDWLTIAPHGDAGGLLCINCMARAFANLGRTEVPLKITAGPFKLLERQRER